MNKRFVEGDKSSKRVRLNRSEVYYYGSRLPPSLLPASSFVAPIPVNFTTNNSSCSSTKKEDPKKPSHSHYSSTSSASQNLVMQEILAQTQRTAAELTKLRHEQAMYFQQIILAQAQRNTADELRKLRDEQGKYFQQILNNDKQTYLPNLPPSAEPHQKKNLLYNDKQTYLPAESCQKKTTVSVPQKKYTNSKRKLGSELNNSFVNDAVSYQRAVANGVRKSALSSQQKIQNPEPMDMD